MSELSESHRLVTIQRSLLTRLAAQRRLETVEQAVHTIRASAHG